MYRNTAEKQCSNQNNNERYRYAPDLLAHFESPKTNARISHISSKEDISLAINYNFNTKNKLLKKS